MSDHYDSTHSTHYRYARPELLGEHRVLLQTSSSYDKRRRPSALAPIGAAFNLRKRIQHCGAQCAIRRELQRALSKR